MIKVPATIEGLPAIEQLICEGINVNATLLFGLPRYRLVVEAYISGLEKRIAQGGRIDNIASVASFFLSRIDTLIDPLLKKIIDKDGVKREVANGVLGEVAISSAKVAYQLYKEFFGTLRFKKLEREGARTQRLLWASTSNKNPDYSDLKYIEPLIGANTVNTLPPVTIDAYRDQGDPQASIEQNIEKAKLVLESLPQLCIDIDLISQQLEEEGVKKFIDPFDKLLEILSK